MRIDQTALLQKAAMARKTPQIDEHVQNEKLKEQCDAFEAIILKMLLDETMKGNDPLLPKDPGRDIYRSMMNDQRAKELSGAFGYSELLYNYLSEKSLNK